MATGSMFRLPAELRAQIWQYCLPSPRHIILSARNVPRGTPVIFHVCHDSRAEAARHYVLAPDVLEVTQQIDSRASVWIDFTEDTICVDGFLAPNITAEITPTLTMIHVQRLAFEFSPPQNFMQLLDILTPLHRCLGSMPALKEVVLYSMPKKWFEDHTGRVQERHPPLSNTHDAARILLRLLHMLFGGHAWLDSGAGIPPPLRWQFVCNDEANVWAGPFPAAERHEYVFRCASTGKFEIHSMTWEQLGRLRRVQSTEKLVHHLVGSYDGCPEHDAALA